MPLIKKILNKVVTLIQLILIVIFIVFEEIIWEGFAKPIYEYIHGLGVLRLVEAKLQNTNRYIILAIFMILLVGVEITGMTAGMMILQGMIVTGVIVYSIKIPIAAFTFWLFRVTDEKLLSFGWFKWSYEKIMALFAWIKSRDLYKNTIKKAKKFKEEAKVYLFNFKAKYFSGDNKVSKRFKRLYVHIKSSLKKG